MPITKRVFLISFLAELLILGTEAKALDNIDLVMNKLSISKYFEQIKNRILKNQGMIRVYVHPFYISKDKTMDQNDLEVKKKAIKIESGLWKNLDSVVKNTNSAPLFIFEEKGEIFNLREKIKAKYGEIPSGVFIIPIEEGVGVPDTEIFGNEKLKIPFEEMTHEEVEFKEIFKTIFYDKLGVRKMVLGGAYFDLESLGNGVQTPIKCAGDIYRWFKEIGVTDIKLSRFLELDREQLKEKGLK